MGNKIRAFRSGMKGVFACALCGMAWASEPVERDFFADTIRSVDRVVNILDYGANGVDSEDDSAALQSAIDEMAALPKGGRITIPAGTFHLLGIVMKSNVHLEIDAGATIVPAKTSGIVFSFGLSNKGADAAVTVTNASIRGVGGRYTVDFSHCPPAQNKMQFAKLMNVNNYMVADFSILDNRTKMSCLNFGKSTHNGVYYQPANGLIKNGHAVNGHWGYGLIQAQCASNHLFKNLSCVGGITLRMETGALLREPDYIRLENIYARNISITNGYGAVHLGPHTRDNGHIDVAHVTAVSSLWAVESGAGYVAKREEGMGLTPGSFAASSIIRDIHAVYGENAELIRKNFDEIPYELQSKISAEPVYAYGNVVHVGPSACAARNIGSAVTMLNATLEGFDYQKEPIVYEKDPYPKVGKKK